MSRVLRLLLVFAATVPVALSAQTARPLPEPAATLGFEIGTEFEIVRYENDTIAPP